jgi:hypothetical protein
VTITALPRIEFQPLPPVGGRRINWRRIADQLAENPGEWAPVARIDNTGTRRDRFATHGLEHTVRTDEVTGERFIWARYIGPTPVASSKPRGVTRHPMPAMQPWMDRSAA